MCVLEKVRHADYWKRVDVEAYTDGYAYDGYSHLYLFSIAGHEARVKAITSALVTGKEIQVKGTKTLYLYHDFSQKYRILSTKLGSGLVHQVVLADGFFRSADRGRRLLCLDEERRAPEIAYSTIKSDYAVPLVPEWSEWLYDRLKQEDCIEELSGTRKVIRISVAEEELDSFISEGIKNGEIDF